MTKRTTIEWTEHTWNPVIGCTKISAGCKHCYAEVMAKRLQAMGAPGYEDGFRTVRLMPERLREPLLRRKPSVYFVNSMSDLFHQNVPEAFVKDVFDVMREAKQHTFQLLTKRAARLSEFSRRTNIPSNVWLGVSVENRRHGLPRIEHLKNARAEIRFLSIEPLLEDIGELDLSGISWVIVGGESGHYSRPMKEEWAISVREQCSRQKVPFFFKQWGSFGPDGTRGSKKSNGRMLGGRTWDEMPPRL